MSLRTKLLAVVVGLPVAILLLALGLFVQRGEPTSHGAIEGVIQAASRERLAVGPAILAIARRGEFQAIYLVKPVDARDGRQRPAEVWPLSAYYEKASAAEQVVAMPERRDVLDTMRQALLNSPPIHLSREYLALPASEEDEGLRVYGFVCRLKDVPDTAQSVYFVLLGGIALLMVVFYWLLSTWVIRPLRALSAAADRIADGDYSVRIPPDVGHDEFGRSIRALNRMAIEIGEYQGHLEDRVLTALGRIKKAEQHLTIAQRLAATGKLASGLAHEINNPLGGMKNAVRSLARGDLSPAKTELYLDLIADGLTRVEQTVKKFLTFTPRRTAPRPSDLGDIAEKSVGLAMHRISKKSIEVDTQVPAPGEAIVFGDPHELQQVALNLVLNAADAVEEGGEGRIRVVVVPGADEVVLRVVDNGSGMSTEDQDRCFDMFFTTKEVGEGSGMGLAVVHNIVTNHGGRIEFTSALGQGTTFEVFLPREAAPARAQGSRGPAPASRDGPVPGPVTTP
ncbi:MAG: HAMP domain-containing sensor histidine kinase [Planctomycetota bacterium]|nr:HAMP domain-containing sensor histidine kinase [Planctomycetota bacterium]